MPRWPKRKPRPGVDEYGRTPLWYKALEGDLVGIKREIAAGADPNCADDEGYTPLHAAVQERHVDAVELLLRSGADANRADIHGNLPIWDAVLYANDEGSEEIIKLLLRAGTDSKLKNKYGNCPHALAIEIGHGLEKLFAKKAGRRAKKKG